VVAGKLLTSVLKALLGELNAIAQEQFS